MPCRDINKLCSKAISGFHQMRVWADARPGGTIPFFVTMTLRTPEEHAALHAQGRETLETTNALRLRVGWPLITEKENERCVTWTKHTKHFPDEDGLSHAFDIAILNPETGNIYDPKRDADHNDRPDWEDLATFWESLGEEYHAGYFFPEERGAKNRDACHFEVD